MVKSMVEKYEQILAADAGSMVFIELARALGERGEAARAVEVCDRGLVHHPRSVQGRVLRGRALLLLGRLAEAREEFDRAIGLDAENPYAFNLVGEALLERRQFAWALPVLRRAAMLQPGDLRVRGWLEVAQREVNAAGPTGPAPEVESPEIDPGGTSATGGEVPPGGPFGPGSRALDRGGSVAEGETAPEPSGEFRRPGVGETGFEIEGEGAAGVLAGANRAVKPPAALMPLPSAERDVPQGWKAAEVPALEWPTGYPIDELTPSVPLRLTSLPATTGSAAPGLSTEVDRTGLATGNAVISENRDMDRLAAVDGALLADGRGRRSTAPASAARGPAATSAPPPPRTPPPLPRQSGLAAPPKAPDPAMLAAEYEAELRRRLVAERVDRTPGFLRRHRVGIASIALVVVAALAGALAWNWVRAGRRDEELAAGLLRARAGLARDTHAGLRDSVGILQGVLEVAPNHAAARALDASARASLAVVYEDGDVEVARPLVEAADVDAEPGAVLSARRLLARNDEERRTVDDAILASLASSDPELDSLAGVILVARGQPSLAIARFNAAISAGAGHVPTFLRIGDYYRSRGEHEEALSYYGLALAVAEDHPGAVLGAAESRLASTTDPSLLGEALARIDRLVPESAVPVADRVRLVLVRSRLLSALDDRAGALAALSGIEERVGGDRNARVAMAEALADAGAYDRAETILATLLAEPSGGLPTPTADAVVREALARVLLALERYAAVVELPGGPEERQLHLWKGVAWLRLGQLAKARAALRATATPPEQKLPADAVAYLALADLAGGEVARARANLERVGQGPRARPTGRWAYGTVLEAQGRLDEARATFEEAIAADPHHLESRCALGRLLLARGEIEPAIEQLTRAVEINPFHREALVALGLARLEAGEPALALGPMRSARALAPKDPVVAAALAMALVANGKAGEAEAAMAGAAAARDPLVFRARGALALAKGDVPAATRALLAVATTPDVSLLASLGDLHLSAGDGRAALAAFSQAEKVGGASLRVRLGVARAQVALGRTADAEKALLELLASLPQSASVSLRAASHAALAEALLPRPRELGRARSAAEEAVRLAPRSAAAQLALGRVLAEAGEGDLAVPRFDRAIELAPNDASIWLARGLFLAGRNSGAAEARRDFAKAIELAPGSPVATLAQGGLRRLK